MDMFNKIMDYMYSEFYSIEEKIIWSLIWVGTFVNMFGIYVLIKFIILAQCN